MQAVLPALEQQRRATIVMPCATGKTLVQLSVAQQFERILLLEPSLALIRQSLQRASSEGLLDGKSLLCVCSDEGVAKDAWRVEEGELGAPVTTDANQIRTALRDVTRGAVVFCTYQSLPILAEGLPAGFEFDIAIFDECHRTAGAVGKRFGVGLSDNGIPVHRRLFATATPRVFSAGADDDAVATFAHSMDDVDVYGEIVYRMSVREAIARGIICDYQVLVSATTEAVAREAMVKARDMILPQGEVPVELVGAQLSVLRAMQVSGARRVVSYHSTIAEAQDFASDTLGLFESYGVSTFHIFGAMPSNQRSAVIEAFLSCPGPALISNARCLTEGVDVPAIDLVALMSRRESLGDVVQILGRALRPYPGKDTGYVMLPLFVDATIAPEQALSHSDMAVTWEILHTILETDDDPTDFHALRASADIDQERGRARSRGKLRVVASEDVLSALERGIVVRSVTRLAHERETMLQVLRDYRAREGHARVPRNHVEGQYRLGAWLRRMRKLRAAGRLDPELEKALLAADVEFGFVSHDFDKRVEELRDYFLRRKTWRFKQVAPWTSLARFASQIRKQAHAGTLVPEQRAKLEEIGFPFERYGDVWNRILSRIKERVIQAGTLQAAWSSIPDLERRWLRRQHRRWRAGQLSASQNSAVCTIGVDLSQVPAERREALPRLAGEESFARSLAAVQHYAKAMGKDVIPADVRHQGVELFEFVRRCRKLLKRGLLSEDRIQRLDSIGVRWRPPGDVVAEHIQRLKSFREANGHMKLPSSREFARLRGFVQTQRKNRNKLSEERIRELEAIGFTWDFEADSWESNLTAMKRLRAEGKKPWSTNAQGDYLRSLQRKHKSGELSRERVTELISLGIPWARVNGEEAAMLARLARIARTFGKVNVETMLKREKDLQEWVGKQRLLAQRGELAEATEEGLRKCGIKLSGGERKADLSRASRS